MNRVIFLLIGIIIAVIFMQDTAQSQELSADEIMVKVDTRTIPADMVSDMTMDLIDKRGNTRSRAVNTNRMSDDKMIMWFLKPADIKGSSFLRISYDDRDDDMWIYLPAFRKVRRIASHAKKGSFMGSDFTYEDMGDRKVKDYTYKKLKESDKFGEYDCWVVESTPVEGLVTDYSKIFSWIWKDDFFPVKEEFYDKRGNLKKVKEAELIKTGKYWTPGKMTMEDIKSMHKTVLVFDKIEVDTGLDEKVFSTNYLKRIR